MAHFFPANSRLDVERAPSLGRRTQSRTTLRETTDDASSDSRATRPSHINWLQNSLATTHAGPSMPRRPPSVRLGRSASLSALAGPPPALHRQPSLISNHSLQLDRSRTDNPGAPSSHQHPTIKPLSPISERSYIPTPKREQHFGDVEPSTPVSAVSSYSAFLRRPLKRSISATSTSSLRTNATSTHPPILPPLNLPPLDIRPAYPPVSHRAGQQLVSTVYEDAGSERTASFVTALGDSPDEDDAEDTVEAPYSHGPSDATFLSGSSSDPLADPDQAVEGTTLTPTLPGGSSSSSGGRGGVGSSSGYGSGSSRNNDNTGSSNASGSGSGGGNSSSSGAIPPARPRLRPRRRAPATSGGTGSTSDTFIWRRWTRELSFGSGLSRPSFSAARRALASRLPPLPVLLFWAGFLAPWCWLIGGWLIAEGRWEDSGKARAALPLWKSRPRPPRGATAAEKQKRRGGAGSGSSDAGVVGAAGVGGVAGAGGSQRFPADSLGKDLEKGETTREREREREGQVRTGEEEAASAATAEAAEAAGARSGKEGDEAAAAAAAPPAGSSGRARRVLWIPFASCSRHGAATAAGMAGLRRPSRDAEKVVTLVKPYSAEVWVYRCRLAAVVSAIVLFTALIVALVVIGRPKS